jgi:hypothetical protein
MAPFVLVRDTPLSPEAAWARIVDWPQHARWVPLTTIEVTTPPPTGLHTVFNARTSVGRIAFDDPMEVVEWSPPAPGRPGHCRLEKRGTVMLGWAELSVRANGSGARVTWREDAMPAKAPRIAARAAALSGRLLFGRVLRGLLAD